jgi:hypothetical protein
MEPGAVGMEGNPGAEFVHVHGKDSLQEVERGRLVHVHTWHLREAVEEAGAEILLIGDRQVVMPAQEVEAAPG